jgi:hypothetical protein
VQRILKEQGPRFVTAAGRGDLSGLEGAEKEDESERVDAADFREPDEGEDDAPENAEPRVTFYPAECRRLSAAPAVNGSGSRSGGLAGEDVRRLQATLTHLLELKRLLDQARD